MKDPKICTSLQEAVQIDPVVFVILKNGGTAEDCVVALVNDKERFIKRILELEGIAPRKVSLPDGRIFVWHCPDELIPDMGI